MELEKTTELMSRLREDLDELEAGPGAGLKKMVACLAPVRQALETLRQQVIAEGFRDEADEIHFFKGIKPAFYCLQIYYIELGTIEDQLPVGDSALQAAYLQEQLRFIERFFRQQAFLYHYYLLGADELDRSYFLRDASGAGILSIALPEADPAFSTPCDYLFAKFMAYEMVQAQLLERISVSAEGSVRPGLLSRKGIAVRWTADTCNLIELIYGLYETRQVNNGEVDLSDLMDVFEQVFQVNLSRYFHRFTEIKRRKTISKTKFLDQMREAVNQRIEDGDAVSVKKVKSSGGVSGRTSGSGSSDKMDFLKDNPYL